MKHLEDKRRCPGCGMVLHRQPYVMARQATENVIGWTAVAWIVVVAMLAVVLAA